LAAPSDCHDYWACRQRREPRSREACRGRVDRRKREIYAGVRDAVDLSALKAVRAAGALIATALHEGRVGKVDLQAI
jgi:hypothetical protein